MAHVLNVCDKLRLNFSVDMYILANLSTLLCSEQNTQPELYHSSINSRIKRTWKEGSSHLHSVGWSRPCYEGLCYHCRTSRLGLFQQAQLVCDIGHLFLQALSFNTDLSDFLSSGCCQERLFEVYQVQGPLLLQTHQSAELIELTVHIGL